MAEWQGGSLRDFDAVRCEISMVAHVSDNVAEKLGAGETEDRLRPLNRFAGLQVKLAACKKL